MHFLGSTTTTLLLLTFLEICFFFSFLFWGFLAALTQRFTSRVFCIYCFPFKRHKKLKTDSF